jgi:hypothetical protein
LLKDKIRPRWYDGEGKGRILGVGWRQELSFSGMKAGSSSFKRLTNGKKVVEGEGDVGDSDTTGGNGFGGYIDLA